MTHLYRISKAPYAEDLSGEGARLYGGRWNRKGVPVLYTSETVSLAALEILVNLSIADFPDDFHLLTIGIPEDLPVKTLTTEMMPYNWREYPAPAELAAIGTNWCKKGDELLLRVPSSVVPHEWNVLINPLHEMMEQVTVASCEPFGFDARLKGTLHAAN